MANFVDLKFITDDSQLDKSIKKLGSVKSQINSLVAAEKTGQITTEQFNKRVSTLATEFQKAAGGSISARNAIFKYSREVYQATQANKTLATAVTQANAAITTKTKGMSRFGVVSQQAGYQFSDFIVQVQSGQSAFVAFSQQATQLVGVLPLLFASASTGLIAFTAGLSIAIPLLSALGNAFFMSRKKSDDATDSVGDFASVLEKAKEEAKGLKDEILLLNSGFKDLISAQLDINIEAAKKELEELRQQLESDIGGNSDISRDERRNLRKQGVEGAVDNSGIEERIQKLQEELNVRIQRQRLIEAAEIREARQVAYVEELNQLVRDRQKLIQDQAEETQKVNEFYNTTTQSLQEQISLLGLQVRYGKESVQYKEAMALLARQEYEANLLAEGVQGAQLQNLLALYDTMVQTQEKARETTEAIAWFKDSDLPFTDRVAALAQKLGIAADEAKRLVDNLPRGMTFGNPNALSGLSGDELIFGGQEGDIPNKVRSAGGASQQNPLEQLKKQLELERELVGVSEDRARVIKALGLDFVQKNPEIADGLQEQIAKTRELIEAEKERQSVLQTVETSLENGLMSMVEGTKSVKDAFKDMARAIIKELYDVYVVQRLVGGFGQSGGSGSGLLGLLGGLFGKASGGTVMSNQPYLVGEKGPELIVPRNRGHVMNADLTANAMNGGGTVVVNQSFHFQANGDESVKKLIARAAPSIASMAKQSVVDARRRGGAMKNAFG